MKLIVLLLLVSCASAPKPDVWTAGECVEFTPRSVMGRISQVTEQNGILYYSIDLYKEELQDKPMTKIDCNQEGFGKPVRANKT